MLLFNIADVFNIISACNALVIGSNEAEYFAIKYTDTINFELVVAELSWKAVFRVVTFPSVWQFFPTVDNIYEMFLKYAYTFIFLRPARFAQ